MSQAPSNSDDINRANFLLNIINSNNITGFYLDNRDTVSKAVEKIRKYGRNNIAVVIREYQRQKISPQNEHAERVQIKFRDDFMREFGGKFNTPPIGTKVQCLGCYIHFEVYHPELHDKTDAFGTYYEKDSPIKTQREKDKALELLRKGTAYGSITQCGRVSLSDQVDSDSDLDGKKVYPKPKSFHVKVREKPPTSIIYTDSKGNEFKGKCSFSKSLEIG